MSHSPFHTALHHKSCSGARRTAVSLAALLLIGHHLAGEAAPATTDQRVDYQAELPKAPPAGPGGYFTPPSRDAYPTGPFGEAVRRGEALFMDTRHAAADYVGNGMNCANCHIDGGRQPNAAPLWAAWVSYPAYRKKNDHVNSMEERIRGCFTYSMNAKGSKAGHAPEPGNPLLTDLQAYMYWLAKGAPTAEKMPGRGYPKLPDPPQPYSPERGAKVYADNCAICHGADGGGTRLADGGYAFPPLWGPDSFNWGAGMHRVNTAAGFIKANMPLGKPDSLSLQEAWDVAAFINRHERPGDPRDQGDLAATDARFHKHQCYYGEKADGKVLGAGTGN
jgi:thiosulfate dehydrogenase